MAPAAMLDVVVAEALWVRPYPVRLAGATFGARMTVIRLGGGEIIIHSPCPFDPPLAAAIAELGPVAAIIAPGNLHWLHVRSCQQAFPEARTFVCPGVERRAQSLAFDGVLGDEAPPLWAGQLSQVALQGTGLVREVAFFHRRSRTLILVDLIENFTPATPGTNLFSRMIFRALGMWGRPAPRARVPVRLGRQGARPGRAAAHPGLGLRTRDPVPRRPHQARRPKRRPAGLAKRSELSQRCRHQVDFDRRSRHSG